MKKLLLLFSTLLIYFSISTIAAQCDMTFNPAGNVYNPGDAVSVTICFQDYTAGFPQYEKADWDLDNDGNWDITVTGDDGSGITITALGSGNTKDNTYCVKVEFTAGSQGNTISITATAEGLTHGCQVTQTQSYTLLPIILESFEVSSKGSKAVLNWVTLAEFNNEFFTVEMSLDGENFEDIGEVTGAGNSLDRNEYSFEYDLGSEISRNPFIYFRLRQTDFEGLTSNSEVVLLTNKSKDRSVFNLTKAYYGNSTLFINISSQQTGNVDLKLIDLNGKTISNQKIGIAKGINEIDLPLSGLESGIYIIQIISKNQAETKKLFIN